MIDLLTTKAWMFESRYFSQISPIVLHRIATGRDLSPLINREESPKVEAGETERVGKNLYYSWEDGYHYPGAEEDTIISRTRIQGGISKNGGLCSYGTRHMGDKLQLADEKKKVVGHILEIDSPGGAVDGTPELGNIVANLQKPVVAYVDGMMASAAYWLGSQANWIVTNQNNYTEVGSIGTLFMMVNESGWLKKEGLKVEIIRAEQSKDKARGNTIEEWPEETLNELKSELKAITSDFIATVNRGRNGKLFTMGEDIFTGKMYDQHRALSMGMIDQVGTLEDAIKAMNQIAYNKRSLILN